MAAKESRHCSWSMPANPSDWYTCKISCASASPERLSNPSRQFARDEMADDTHAFFGIVEAGDGDEVPPASVMKIFGVLVRDFLQRLKAIRRKAGRDDRDVLHA